MKRNPDVTWKVEPEAAQAVASPTMTTNSGMGFGAPASPTAEEWLAENELQTSEYIVAVINGYASVRTASLEARVAEQEQRLHTYAEERKAAKRELAEAKFAPLGDNHHNAAKCPYCNPEYTKNHTAQQKLAAAEARVRTLEQESDLYQRRLKNSEDCRNNLAKAYNSAFERADALSASLRDVQETLNQLPKDMELWAQQNTGLRNQAFLDVRDWLKIRLAALLATLESK